MMSDIRYAMRSLRRTPGFTFVVLATLAIGIGANTAMFSVVNAVLLKPFPYADVDSLMRIRAGTSYMDLTDIGERMTSITGAGAHRSQFFDYSTGSEAERLDGMLVTGNMLPLFGAAPLLGRLLSPSDDHAGAERVVVLGSAFWRSHFGGDPKVAGRAISLNGQAYTIVGVLSLRFSFPAAKADVVAPFLPEAGREATARGAHTLAAFVRLKPGVTRAAVQEEMNALAGQLAHQYPRSNTDVRFRLQELRQNVTGDVRQPLVILLSTVGLVLLIACVNVANLLIARGAARRTELAVRAAIGATKGRNPGEDVLGRRVRWASGDGTWITIVGVVADVRGLSLDQAEVPAVHMPYAQEINAWRRWMDVGIRTDSDATALAPLLRQELLAIDRNVPLAKVRTMEDVLAASVAERRFNLLLLGAFAAIALLLAAAGTYGVMAYLVTQRTREIGVRLAVGARPVDVFRLVVGRGLFLAVVGVVIGMASASMLSRVLKAMLFNVEPNDAITFGLSALVLLMAAALASFVPARRAARMDPLEALRTGG